MNDKLIEKAIQIALRAHEGQKDKGGNPYILHPLFVASMMQTEEEIIVALLHDVIEDSFYTINDLRREGFPEKVLDAIQTITREDGEDYFAYIDRVKRNSIASTVKLADLWHNSCAVRLNRKPTEVDLERISRYEKARVILMAWKEHYSHGKVR